MATHIPGPAEMKSDWYVLDADSQVLGRLAGRVAVLLMGKHKPDYTPFLATGDHVVVINAAKVRLTGKKEEQKLYRRYSGYPGGLKETNAAKVRATRLRVYRGAQHPHAAQKPRPV